MAKSDDPIMDAAAKLARAFFTAAAIGLPVLLFVVLGAPEWVSTVFLISVVLGLTAFVIRARLRR